MKIYKIVLHKRISALCFLALYLILLIWMMACESSLPNNQSNTQFTLLTTDHTGVDFTNQIEETLYFNFINYSYVYNGGGVSAGDINNDGLVDLYFTANQTANKLYLNKGNLQFEDITASAHVTDDKGWTTGVTMIDINTDGLIDIYVCKSGSLSDHKVRENLLYINQGDLTFKESAVEFGLNDAGFSTQAYFLDFDHDEDLDMYLVNHRADFNNNTNLDSAIHNRIIPHFSDQLYENREGKFINVSEQGGILNSTWGLSAAIGDYNNDGWEDIYVCNDFLQPDYLYLNNQNGTFTEALKETFDHIPQNSMGSDWADVNNDGLMELMVVEMSPEDHVRSKSNMPSMSTTNFDAMVEAGYHYQYMSNALQLNNGNSSYSEIAQLAGLSKTDWSWSTLLADFNNDGYNDAFVTNGIVKDLSNSDYRQKIKKRIESRVKMSLDEARDMIPSHRVANYIFENEANLHFSKKSKDWGLDQSSFSNGATYADLDNDGDLDLAVNNAMDPAFIYRNNSESNYLKIALKGPKDNPLGIGATVTVQSSKGIQVKQQYLSRGFQSSVSPNMIFGLGAFPEIDHVKIVWPDGKTEEINSPVINSQLRLDHHDASETEEVPDIVNPLLKQVDLIDYRHQETPVNDFEKQLLLPYKLSNNGPHLSKGDVNGDGLDDLYIGGSAGYAATMLIQNQAGTFEELKGVWKEDRTSEDIQSIFFDYDRDGDQDLYVVSGSYEFDKESEWLQDRLYRNDGKGDFVKVPLPNMQFAGSVVVDADVDGDGDLDLFVGARVVPGQYPLSSNSALLINENGSFIKQELGNLGMVTDARFVDYDQDGDQDLIVVGEWQPIKVLENMEGDFKEKEIAGLTNSRGLWFSLETHDIDGDGDLDFIVGNLGLNSKFKVGNGKEFHVFANDFDDNGSLDIVLSNKYQSELVPTRGLQCSSEQVPAIKTKFKNYHDFATASLEEVYGDQLKEATHLRVDLLHSVWIENLGDSQFKINPLPTETQFGTILGIEFMDVDNDGRDEMILVGNIYESEVETVRYDASKGTILKWEKGALNTLSNLETGLFLHGNIKQVQSVRTTKGEQLWFSTNQGAIQIYLK